MRTFKQYLKEGQLTVDMKKMTSKDRKEFIALAQSLKIKRKFDLSFASVSLGRWLNLKAYYLDLNDFIAYITDKGYKYRNQAGITKNIAKSLANPDEIVMENLDEANNKTAFLQRVMPRFPGLDKKLGKDAWDRIVQVVKPKNNINSKRYVELGKIFDTGNYAKMMKALGDMEKKDGIR